jgi:hypothetical protein
MSAEKKREINWQEAVSRLTRERTAAEICADLLKKHGDAAAVSRGALAYGDAKADYDGIIAGLIVALAQKAAPASLPDLEIRLQRAFEKRQSFCHSVKHFAQASRPGDRNVIADLVQGAIEPLLEALKVIWLRSRDDDAQMRKTIETQLEAAIWRDFGAVEFRQ